MEDLTTYLKSTFGFSDNEIERIYEKITIRDLDLIKSKVDFYKKTLNLTDAELSKIIKISPALLGYDTITVEPTSVKSKMAFYKQTFKLTDAELSKRIKSFPALLGYDTITDEPTSVKSKVAFYKQTFNLTDAELSKIIKTLPQLFCLDTITDEPTSVKSKMKKLHELGFVDDVIKNCPLLLTYPCQHLKMRYMLFTLNRANPNSLSRYLMTNEEVVFSRRQYLLSKGLSTKAYSYYSDKIFMKRCVYNSESLEENWTKEKLIERYPLTREEALKIQDAYNEANPEMPMTFTEKELSLYKSTEVNNG